MRDQQPGPHPFGLVRLEDTVKQACPCERISPPNTEHPLGVPSPFCPWCFGSGLLTNEQFGNWQRAENAKLGRG